MYEIAEATSNTSFPTIEPTTRFSEICDRTEFAVDRARSVPARIERIAGFLCRVLVFEAGVNVADEIYQAERLAFIQPSNSQKSRATHTIIIIITNDYLLRLSILAHLAPKVLIERIEVVLQLTRIHLVLGIVGWVLVEVGE